MENQTDQPQNSVNNCQTGSLICGLKNFLDEQPDQFSQNLDRNNQQDSQIFTLESRVEDQLNQSDQIHQSDQPQNSDNNSKQDSQICTRNRLSSFVEDQPNQSSQPQNSDNNSQQDLLICAHKRETKRKKNCCIFCNQYYANIVQHFEQAHEQEDDVKKFSILPKGSSERRKIIDILRKKGNFGSQHYGDKMIPVRLPRKGLQTEYVPCPRCKGFYSKQTLRKHYPNCQSQGKSKQHYGKSLMVLSRKVACELPSYASDTLRSVFSHLREDNVVKLIRQDRLIISYGNKLCKKFKDPHHAKEIRAKLRLLGRLLIELKKYNPEIKDLCSVYQPKYYDACIKAVTSLSHVTEDEQKYQNPVVALSLGTLLKKVGRHMKSYLIQTAQMEKSDDLKQFMHLLTEDYGTAVSKTAYESLSQIQRNKSVDLPLFEDLRRFYEYLCQKRQEYFKKLLQGYSYKTWKTLAAYTLISIQVFNRRRPGEIERMKVTDYLNVKKIDYQKDKDTFASLDVEEKLAAKEYMLIPLRGKLGRAVNAIVDKEAYKCLSLTLKYRSKAGVHEKNPYVFGLASLDDKEPRHLNACNLMRQFSEESGVSNPNRLRATLLRKHIATHASTLGLKEDEISNIADHLGHEKEIHKLYYRQPIVTREITQMSTLLKKSLEKPQTTTTSSRSDQIEETSVEEVDVSSAETSKDTYTKTCSEVESEIVSEIIISNSGEILEVVGEQLQIEQNVETSTTKLINNDQVIAVEDNADFSIVDNDGITLSERNLSPVFDDWHLETNNSSEPELTETIVDEELVTYAKALELKLSKQIEDSNIDEISDSTEKNQDIIDCKSASPKMFQAKVLLTPLKVSTPESKSNSDSDLEFTPQEECKSDSTPSTPEKISRRKPKLTRKTWTTPEKAIVKQIFSHSFQTGTLPSQEECRRAVEEYAELKTRTGKQLYAWMVQNVRKKEYQPKSIQLQAYDEDKIQRRTWTTPEKLVIRKHFQKYIDDLRLPKYLLCKKIHRENPELQSRTCKQLYAYVNNQIQKKKKIPGYGEYSPVERKEQWSSPDKKLVTKLFARHIEQRKLPSTQEIVQKVMRHPEIKHKKVDNIQKLISYETKRREFAKNARKRLFEN